MTIVANQERQENLENILKQMTLSEKASLLAGADMWYTVPLPRLNIPAIQVSDGPNGVRGDDDNIGTTSTCFPVGSAMGATWNPELIYQVGQTLAAQIKAKNAHVLLAPTVNMHRTPTAGRNFECYSEDPHLTGTMASAYINGLQDSGVSACIKHFVCNDQEYERFSISSEVSERALHEIYLEPFRIALEKAHPWSIMSAYNRINGVYASENETTLRDILKGSWDYDGLVISDWYGTYSENVPAGGLDLEMPGPARWMDPQKVVDAVQAGELDEAVIDDKVRRLLRLMERVGAFEQEPPQTLIARDTAEERALTRQTAVEAIVLLKNKENLLPIDLSSVHTIAVIGENARWAQIHGGGSSKVNPHYAISPLEGIVNRVGDQAAVSYTIGAVIHKEPPLLDMAWLTTADGRPGSLTLEYFDNLDLQGQPIHTADILKTELTYFGSANKYVNPANFSLRLSGTFTPPESRVYEFHLSSIGPSRLHISGQCLIDNWQREEGGVELKKSAVIELQAGKPVSLLLEYSSDPHFRWRFVRLGSQPPTAPDPIQAAADLAAQSDLAIIVAGLTREWESEGFDRPDISLPGDQDELISRVVQANPRTIVLLNAGSPVEMPWVDEVPALLQTWYLGQETGRAIAAILFGDENPSGKLPTTFPVRFEDNPAFINYPGENGQVHYGEGIFIGYRYYDIKDIDPCFPFGHGLSYTTYDYANLQLNGESFTGDQEIVARFELTNTGRRAGQEIVQLYLRDEQAKVTRPEKELKTFLKVRLDPGQTKTIALTLNKRDLSFYDTAVHDWIVEPGRFTLLIGASSRDIRLQKSFDWQENKDQ